MPAVYSITGYYNTGFNRVNRPSRPSVLSNATTVIFPSNYLWQQNGIAKTKIRATWQVVENIDYVQIGSAYYFVNNITMTSPETAELDLSIDSILTLGGVDALTILAGWAERAHVASGDDYLFGNILSEPWAPSGELELDAIERIGPVHDGNNINIIHSTVKLTQLEYLARVYSTAAGSTLQGEITVPEIPVADNRCTFNMTIHGDPLGYVYPAGSFYNFDTAAIRDAVNEVRSLGIDAAIVDAYQVPAVYSSTSPAAELVAALANISQSYSPSANMLYRYGSANVHNNKVYAMYNSYHVLSSCSGDAKDFDASDIFISGSDRPQFTVFADLGPQGKPYLQPTMFRGAVTGPFQQAIAGAPWLRLPFAFTGQSGARVSEAAYRRDLEQRGAGIAARQIQQSADIVKSLASGDIVGAIGGAARGSAENIRDYMSIQAAAAEHLTSKNIVAPEIAFPQNQGAQSYLGNTFYIYRTRLSDNDMIRCDNFFTQFGYAQDKILTINDFRNRTYFNFVKARGAAIKGSGPLRLEEDAAAAINAGIRLWHVLPNAAAMTYNP